MKHLKTFENFSNDMSIEEGLMSKVVTALGGTPYSERMKTTLDKNIKMYINQAIDRNFADGASEEEYMSALDMLKEADYKVKNLKKANPNITDKEAKLAEYLFKRADTSVSHLANAGHDFGSKPKI